MAVDPKVLEYRKAMAARYTQLSAEERPKVAVCEDCKQPSHQSRVCLVTGLLHERDKMRLIGGVAVDGDKTQFSGRELMTALDAGRVKWQKARVATIRVDADSSNFFQSFPMARGWKLMRYGILYGKYDAPNRAVSVHGIYEPAQQGSETGYRLLPDPREARVDALAKALGLEHVGIIVTHPPRDTKEVVLSGTELLLGARDQSRFGDHCVIVTAAPDPATQQLTAHGWQTTEQAVRLFQMGTLSPSTKELGFINSTIALEVAKDEKDAKGKPICVVKEPSREIDTRFMTGFCAIEQFHSEIVGNRFMRIDRQGEQPLTWKNLEVFCADEKRKGMPFHKKIRDFHALIFIVDQMLTHGSGFGQADVTALVDAMMKDDAVAMAKYEQWVLKMMR